MMMMKLNALQALLSPDRRWFSRRRARISQRVAITLTKTLRELELELSTTLVGALYAWRRPTLQNQVLYERALNVQRELAAATDTINQMGGNMVGTLSVGAVPLAVMLLVPGGANVRS